MCVSLCVCLCVCVCACKTVFPLTHYIKEKIYGREYYDSSFLMVGICIVKITTTYLFYQYVLEV